MTKRQFIDLIEHLDDHTPLVLSFGDDLVDVCGLSDTITVTDDDGNKMVLFLIIPCGCDKIDDDVDEFQDFFEDEIVEPVVVDKLNLN